jgi:hypothetical protein
MRTPFAWRKVLALVSVSLWMTIGGSAIALAFPAGPEDFGSQTGGSACVVADGLAPQLRKESELRAACAPSVPRTAPVADARQPVVSTTGFPVAAVLPWVGVAVAFGTAVALATIRVRRHTRAAI